LGSLCAPAFQGGTNWPGGCYDPETHIVYVFAETTVAAIGMVPGDPKITEFEYVHGVLDRVNTPGRAMGSAPLAGETPSEGSGGVTVDGLPLLKPPYGTISAIDLKSGDIAWQIAHGETPDNIKRHPALKGLTIPRTGRPGLLGPLVTKTLVICGEAGFATTPSGARGAMLRAYDKATGQEEGAVYIPAPQSGSPMTYRLDGQQYIVLAIGGGNYPAELVAFRQPRA